MCLLYLRESPKINFYFRTPIYHIMHLLYVPHQLNASVLLPSPHPTSNLFFILGNLLKSMTIFNLSNLYCFLDIPFLIYFYSGIYIFFRVLVLPPTSQFNLLNKNKKAKDNDSTFQKFFDLEKISESLVVISMEEFITTVAAKGFLRYFCHLQLLIYR